MIWAGLFGIFVFGLLVMFQTMATGGAYSRPYHDTPRSNRYKIRRKH